jgi:hypothetical protein
LVTDDDASRAALTTEDVSVTTVVLSLAPLSTGAPTTVVVVVEAGATVVDVVVVDSAGGWVVGVEHTVVGVLIGWTGKTSQVTPPGTVVDTTGASRAWPLLGRMTTFRAATTRIVAKSAINRLVARPLVDPKLTLALPSDMQRTSARSPRRGLRWTGSGLPRCRPSPVRVNLQGKMRSSCQSLPNCDGGGLGSVVDAELGHGVLEVALHRLLG